MVKVSVIVPVYNVDKYLERCIVSLINQDIQEMEIILVNDGSEDDSLYICNKYACKDKRIKVLDKINEGVSIARNEAIKIAKGEYIGFVDADDIVEPQMYSSMYNKAVQTLSDVVVCSFNIHKNGGEFYQGIGEVEGILESQDIHDKYILPLIGLETLKINPFVNKRSVWQYLYKKSMIIDNNIKFIEGLPIGEDFIFNIDTLGKAKRMYIMSEALYNYIIYETGATKKYRSNLEEVNKKLRKAIEESYYKAYKKTDILEKRLSVLKINHLFGQVINECKSKKDFYVIKSNINKMCNNQDVKKIIRQKYIFKSAAFPYKIFLVSIKYGFITWISYLIVFFNYLKSYKINKMEIINGKEK